MLNTVNCRNLLAASVISHSTVGGCRFTAVAAVTTGTDADDAGTADEDEDDDDVVTVTRRGTNTISNSR